MNGGVVKDGFCETWHMMKCGLDVCSKYTQRVRTVYFKSYSGQKGGGFLPGLGGGGKKVVMPRENCERGVREG